MEEIINNVLNKYFSSLSVFGYKSHKSIEKVIALLIIDDLISKDFRGHICLDEYQYIERAIECLLGSDCIIPKIDLSNMACLNRLHLGDISEMEHRLKITEANKLRTDMTILQENLSKAFLILAENSTLQGSILNDMKNNLALCCQITNANLTRIGDKLTDMNATLNIKLTEIAHMNPTPPAPQPTVEIVEGFLDGDGNSIPNDKQFYARFGKDGGTIPYSDIVPSGKIYKVSYKKINGVPEDSSLWIKTELEYVIDIPAGAWFTSENKTLKAPANPNTLVRSMDTYINAGTARFPLQVSQDAMVIQKREEVTYYSDKDGNKITLPTELTYNFKKEGGRVEVHELIPNGAIYRTTYTKVNDVVPPKSEWNIQPIGPVASTDGKGWVTANMDYFEATANTGTNQRTDDGNIRIDDTDIPIKFTQDGSGFTAVYTFSASPVKLDFSKNSETKDITVTSNKTTPSGGIETVGYTVKSLPEWVTKVSNTKFSVQTNTGNAKDGAIVLQQQESNKEVSIAVTQAAPGVKTNVFNVKPTAITAPHGGSTEAITVDSYDEQDGIKTPKKYTVTADNPWVKVTNVPTTAKENSTFTITVEANTEYAIRSSKVKVTQEGGGTKEISINQNAKPDVSEFTVNPTSVSLPAGGGSAKVTVTSTHNGKTAPWVIDNKEELADYTWLHVTGEGTDTLNITVDPN